jgi:hypothetical protein
LARIGWAGFVAARRFLRLLGVQNRSVAESKPDHESAAGFQEIAPDHFFGWFAHPAAHQTTSVIAREAR